MAEIDTPVADKIVGVLRQLGIERAHFASRNLGDWRGLAADYPDAIASLTLICPLGFDAAAVEPLADRLLAINADRGRATDTIARNMAGLPSASLVTLSGYGYPNNYADIGVEQGDAVAAAMLEFIGSRSSLPSVSPAMAEGEVDGVYFRVQGSGPPLALTPLGAAPAQWDPIMDVLTERYCVISMFGPALGMVASLEGRGRTFGYRSAVGSIIASAAVQPGESVLEVGCGTGVLCRWLARETGGSSPVSGVDVNVYFLREAAEIARREGMADAVSFHEGSAEELPFDDASFDVTFSSTVVQRVNADLMLPEMVRVTRPGGRVAVLGHAHDMNRWVNLPLGPELKTRIEAPPWVDDRGHPQGCDDAALYRKFAQLGLTDLRMYPFISTFSDPGRLQFLEGGILPTLNAEEAAEWRAAVAQARADGTFFISTPFHCAVGRKG